MSGKGNDGALGGRERKGGKVKGSEGRTELNPNLFSTLRHPTVPLPPSGSPFTHPLIVRVSGPSVTFNKRV